MGVAVYAWLLYKPRADVEKILRDGPEQGGCAETRTMVMCISMQHCLLGPMTDVAHQVRFECPPRAPVSQQREPPIRPTGIITGPDLVARSTHLPLSVHVLALEDAGGVCGLRGSRKL